MRLVVVATNEQKEELLCMGMENAQVEWIHDLSGWNQADAPDALIVLDNAGAGMDKIPATRNYLLILSDLVAGEAKKNTVYFNGLPGFLSMAVLEASSADEDDMAMTNKVFSHFNRKVAWFRGTDGYVTARVIGMIINEAYLALEEKVSSRAEIDVAMKLGTNYPFGPFEWARRIGHQRICALIDHLSLQNDAYQTAPLLRKDSLS